MAAANGSLRVQVVTKLAGAVMAQVQPVPAAAVATMPVGRVSVTVIVPEVVALPTLLAVMVYCAPI